MCIAGNPSIQAPLMDILASRYAKVWDIPSIVPEPVYICEVWKQTGLSRLWRLTLRAVLGPIPLLSLWKHKIRQLQVIGEIFQSISSYACRAF
ncbi:MAG: hypothetical protein N2170_07880 [Bacteroidia bacterium]|nr:hypothetical protein [Bacteroidia bacterium]